MTYKTLEQRAENGYNPITPKIAKSRVNGKYKGKVNNHSLDSKLKKYVVIFKETKPIPVYATSKKEAVNSAIEQVKEYSDLENLTLYENPELHAYELEDNEDNDQIRDLALYISPFKGTPKEDYLNDAEDVLDFMYGRTNSYDPFSSNSKEHYHHILPSKNMKGYDKQREYKKKSCYGCKQDPYELRHY